MYLKALEMQGFKSFPDRTRLTFENNITGIVGPNGSGKSNLSDAIMWVTGEQRSRALRGTKMEDVIFGGTEKRNPMGFAQVSLIFDNTGRIFDYDCDEVTLSRKYYRSGDSEYLINKESCRLKDINRLLMDTGLGRDGYSIIGQGKIAEIVSTKSSDRREIFEEAAGISRFRYRKEEAQNRLEKTEENLLRINDKVEELELQVTPLKHQAEVAKQYLLLRDELRIKEISAWLETLDKVKERSKDINEEYLLINEQLGDKRSDLEALHASSDNVSLRMKEKDREAQTLRDGIDEVSGQIAAADSACAVIRSRIKSTDEQMERVLSDIAQQEQHTAEIRSGISENEEKISVINSRLGDIEKELEKNANIISGFSIKLRSRQDRLAQLRNQASVMDSDLVTLSGKISVLSDMEKDHEGYSNAVRYIMKESKRGSLQGVYGPVAELIDTDGEYALAIETALGASAQFIVVDTQKTGRMAIELLKKTDSGRATFLPVDTIKAPDIHEQTIDDTGLIGTALELVTYPEEFAQVIADRLGKILVAETLADAVRISNKLNNKANIVTLDGQQVNPGGSMTGGSSVRNAGILSRRNELKKLNEQRSRLKQKREDHDKLLSSAEKEEESISYQLKLANEDAVGFNSDKVSLQAEKRAFESAVSQLNALLVAVNGSNEERQRVLKEGEEEKNRLNNELKDRGIILEELHSREAELREQLRVLSESRSALEEKRELNDRRVEELYNKINELERTAARIEQKKQAADMEEKQLLDRLWDTYELGYTSASELRQPVESLQKINREIASLRSRISALGTPNIGAIEEYERVRVRYEYLTGQRDDILKAKSELNGIIGDITKEMTEIFRRRFDEINTAFRQTFLELFGGGKANLVLEDENNILDCGIDIKVQPPGKALSTISLLSGGEMAFVAIALYFAIMKVSPIPFCVMDEIEAALDEANVDRFAEYMRKMSDKTQFLVITHRRGTMEEADMLYGVTMQEKGVSAVIRLNLENAERLGKD